MFKLNVRYIVKLLGMTHLLESFFMLAATGVAFGYGGCDFYPLLISTGIMSGTGLLLYLIGRKGNDYRSGRREGMLSVSFMWTMFSFLGMLPYLISGYIDNVTDAFFETMSGFTTTGATILTDIEALPKGLLFWRSLTQWQGGIGIIVFTVALMPIFGGTPSQLFDAETPSITHERFLPRITQVAKRLFGIYLLITGVVFGLLWIGPMNAYDAINHALTTVSTGGYSTKNEGVAYWQSAYTEYIICFGMCLGATNITLLYFSLRRHWHKLVRDEELHWFYGVIATATVIVTIWLLVHQHETSIEKAFRQSLFQVASLISTTGYLTADYSTWGAFFTFIMLFISVVAGCAGSTSGGLKMGRFVILIKNMLNEFKKQTHPNAVLPIRMSGQIIPSHIVQRVSTFAFVYMGLILLGGVVLVLDGLNFEEALGISVSAVGNVGPALGQYTDGNFSALSAFPKWILSFLMMIGRLEIFTVLTILLPGFWKR